MGWPPAGRILIAYLLRKRERWLVRSVYPTTARNRRPVRDPPGRFFVVARERMLRILKQREYGTMATTYEDILALFRETDRKFQETDRRFQELMEAQKETDRKFQETDRKFQETSKLVSNLGGQWGAVC
jgi:hypothetical protein